MNTTMTDQKIDTDLDPTLGAIETKVLASYTLADALREGVEGCTQARGRFGSEESGEMCALATAVTAARKRGYVS